jgi:hypothetical protein
VDVRAVEDRDAGVEPVEADRQVRSREQHCIRTLLFDHRATRVEEALPLIFRACCRGGKGHVGGMNRIQVRSRWGHNLNIVERPLEVRRHHALRPEQANTSVPEIANSSVHRTHHVDHR